MARQGPRYRQGCKAYILLKCMAKMDLPFTRKPDGRLPKKVLNPDKGDQKERYNDTLNPSLKDLIFPIRLHRIEQSNIASLEKKQISIKQRESVKLKDSVRTQNQNR